MRLLRPALGFLTVMTLALTPAVSPVGPLASEANAATLGSGVCAQTVGNSVTASSTSLGSDCVIEFTSGTNSWTIPSGVATVRYLVVGGGASGNRGKCGYYYGGGGGGGGVAQGSTTSLTSPVSITVGAGGTRGSLNFDCIYESGVPGEASLLGTIQATGGIDGVWDSPRGGNSGYPTSTSSTTGNSGGDGGGVYVNLTCDEDNGWCGAGGGAGAGGAGNGLNGGPGIESDITGTTVMYGAGGSGGRVDASSQVVRGNVSSGGGLFYASPILGASGSLPGSGGADYGTAYGDGADGIVVVRYSLVPQAPVNATATATSQSVSLSWTAPSHTGGITPVYYIEYKSGSGDWTCWNSCGVSSATTRTITGLTDGTTYSFRISATNATVAPSRSTAEVSATPRKSQALTWSPGPTFINTDITDTVSLTPAPTVAGGVAVTYAVSSTTGTANCTISDSSTSTVSSISGSGTCVVTATSAQGEYEQATASVTLTVFDGTGSGACSQNVSTGLSVAVVEDGADCVVAFKSSTGNWIVPSTVTAVDYLVVGGGGGGGSRGGGGAGAFIEGSNRSVTPESSVAISVGAGGALGSTSAAGTNGAPSSFDGVTAYGGGGGSSTAENVDSSGSNRIILEASFSGGNGGSGGGGMAAPPGLYASCDSSQIFSSMTQSGRPAGTSGTGSRNAGGASTGVCYDFVSAGYGANKDASFYIGGGGGGAGEPGFDVTWVSEGETATSIRLSNGSTGNWSGIGFVPGAGGAGLPSTVVGSTSIASALGIGEVSGSSVYFAGGGGGGANFSNYIVSGSTRVQHVLTGGYSLVGDGGLGGGSANGAGLANTGGGGSGWRNGNGGSGVVVVRYTRPNQSTFTLTSGSSSMEYNSTTTLSSMGGSGTGAVSYAVTSGDCSISGTTVTATGGTGTCVITATKAADASYAEATSSVTLTLSKIAQSSLSISVDDSALDYGDTATLSSSGGSGTGAVTFSVNSGDCSISGTTVTASGGTTDCVISAVKAADDDYLQASSANTVTISISKASQTITFASISNATYGAASFTVSPTSDSGLVVSVSSSTPLVCTTSSLTVTLVGAGTCTLTANQAGNSFYSSATGVTRSFTVSAKAITVAVSVANKVYDATTSATVSSGTLSGVVSGDVVSFVAGNAAAAFSSATVGSGKAVTVTLDGDELTGSDAGNYSLSVTGSPAATITAKPVTVNVVPAGKTYDGTQAATVSSATVVGKEAGDTVSADTSKISVTFDAPGAGTQSASATLSSGVLTGADAGNYTASVGTVSSAVISKANQASLSFTSSSSTMFGQTLTLVATGGSGSGSISYLASGDCTISGAVISPTGAGSCSVSATRAADSNYNVSSQATQTVTIAKANQSINFTSTVPASAVSGTTYTPTATASSGLTPSISVTSGSPSVCTESGGVVTFVASGTCVITATQGGDSDYNAASSVTQTIVAGKINQTITFPAISGKDYDDAAFLAGATVSSSRTVTYATSTGSVCAVNASTGLISIKTIGDCTVTASSAGDPSYAAASDVSRTFTISPVVAGKPSVTSVSFGNSSVTVAFTAPGANGGDSIDAYQVVATSSGGSVTKPDCSTTSPCTISGLTNGESYTLTVAAINAAGVGPASDASPAVIPATIPDAVSALSTTPGDTQLVVTWTPLTTSQLGGGSFTQYDVSIRVRGQAWSSPVTADGTNNLGTRTTSSYTFTGLTNGTAYDVKVVALTSVNGTALSSNTATALGVPATAPDAPTGLTLASLSNTSAVASWTAPADDGGSAITAYSVNLSCTFVNATDTFCTLTGLTAGSRVTVTVGATNLMGTGSTVSAIITMPGGSSGGSSGSSGRGTPATPTVTPAVTPTVLTPTLPGNRLLPRPPVQTPRILNAPVVTPTDPPSVNEPARVLVGGRPVPTLTEARGASEVNVRAGKIDLGLGATTPSPTSTVRTNPTTNAPELTVGRGESTSLNVRGLLPGSTLQVWLPGAQGRELARVPVNPDGSVTEEISLTASRTETPLPLGPQVLQVTGFDEDGNQTVVDMTINIAQGAPSPEPNRLIGELPDLQPGQSLATSAGVPEAVTISANAETREVSVSSNEWSFRVVVPEANGTVDAEDPSAPTIRLIQARTAEVNGDGFQPDTRVDIFLFSDPTLLGSFTVGADGSFDAEVFLDARFAVVGDHTLQIQGVGTDGYVKAANLGVLVEEPPAPTTASQASLMLWWVIAAVIALALIIVLVFASRRRRVA